MEAVERTIPASGCSACPVSITPNTARWPRTVADVMKMVKENEVKFVDFRFTDTRGKEQHVTCRLAL
jgi:hypothetical protein